MTIDQFFQVVDNIGTIFLMVAIGYGLWKRHLVIGWVFEACHTENVELRNLLNAHAAKTEQRVASLEQERDKRYGPPA
jgi:hypothetical protein